MPNPYFSFKRFTVHHDRCAMKVGTDGVLLGAWADVASSERLLDIGTGSGLIALMCAQRSNSRITAIDIDGGAVEQAQINFSLSPWKDRLEVVQGDLCDFQPSGLYDVIVSNPPYFIDSLKCPDGQRTTARHTDALTPEQLLGNAYRMLHPQGHLSLVLPYEQSSGWIRLAENYGWFLTRHTAVITRIGLEPKRSLLEFRKQPATCLSGSFTIELERHVYTEEYIALTKEFYLKM